MCFGTYAGGSEISAQLNNSITVVRSRRRRRPALFIKPDGSLELRIPMTATEKAIKEFLSSAQPWLQKKQKLREHAAGLQPPSGTVIIAGVECKITYSPFCIQAQLTSPDTLLLPAQCRDSAELYRKHLQYFYRQKAREIMTPLVKKFAALLGREIKSLRITGAATRWGSCSGSGNINISWRTARLPQDLAELIAAHEAAHLLEMNHSKKFYAVLDSILPDRTALEKRLKNERGKYADQ